MDLPSNNQNQKKYLEAIFNGALCAPVFARHPELCINQFSDSVPYISFNDVMAKRYIIRGRPPGEYNPYDAKERGIIAEYQSIDELVNAGWRLD
jgi:hypothetical protein